LLLFTQKLIISQYKFQDVHPGSGFFSIGIPDPGAKKHRIRNTARNGPNGRGKFGEVHIACSVSDVLKKFGR
jgi:hypothetical protein